MSLYLVRHAKAGSRSDWKGDDMLRPLSKNGWRQSHALAQRLLGTGVTALLTSPYLRCRQTLEPLGDVLDLEVLDHEALTEGHSFVHTVTLLETVPEGTVLCSHGDVIPATIAALERRGCEILTPADWRKATVWTIERGAEGTFVSASVAAPPDI